MGIQGISIWIKEKLDQIERNISKYPVQHHCGIKNVYLATSDWLIVRNLDGFLKKLKESDIFINCGLAGLNFVQSINPSKIIFIDINKYSLIYYLYLMVLLKLSNTRAEFFSFYYSKDAEKIDALLKIGKGSDKEFNQILPDPEICDQHKSLFASLSFPEPMLQFKEAIFKADIFDDHIIPAAPLDQKRKLHLFKADFNSIYHPHPVSFFMNLGWLKDEEAFAETRKIILKSDLYFLNFNLVEDAISRLLNEGERERNLTLYISNIGSTILLGKEKEGYFKGKIIPTLEKKLESEKKVGYYRRVLYQFFVLSKFINELLNLNEFTLITQFGVFDHGDLSAIKRDFFDFRL